MIMQICSLNLSRAPPARPRVGPASDMGPEWWAPSGGQWDTSGGQWDTHTL